MNNEIEEILDKLKLLCYDDYCLEVSVDYIERKEEKILLDYITNLQEEIEDLKEQVKYQDLWRNEYLSRIDKAIEYLGIDEEILETCEIYDVNGIEVYKILQGSDN